MVVRPPIGKQKDYPELILTAIHASEEDTPKDREKIDWKLLTDLPVRRVRKLSRNWNGTRSDGRSRPSTKS